MTLDVRRRQMFHVDLYGAPDRGSLLETVDISSLDELKDRDFFLANVHTVGLVGSHRYYEKQAIVRKRQLMESGFNFASFYERKVRDRIEHFEFGEDYRVEGLAHVMFDDAPQWNPHPATGINVVPQWDYQPDAIKECWRAMARTGKGYDGKAYE